MRNGGWLFVSVLVACGPAASSSGSRVVLDPSAVGAPEGGNGNGSGDESDEPTDVVGASDEVTPPTTAQEIVVSGRGFSPQPAIRTGTAGGDRYGSELSPECVGSFPAQPQHIVKLNGPIDLLRFLVHTDSSDLTLAVRTPDGVFHCDDDSGDPANGYNPTVELYSPPTGTIEVYVGTYSETSAYSRPTYRFGVSEQTGFASDIVGR